MKEKYLKEELGLEVNVKSVEALHEVKELPYFTPTCRILRRDLEYPLYEGITAILTSFMKITWLPFFLVSSHPREMEHLGFHR